jgi:hypothetical protein
MMCCYQRVVILTGELVLCSFKKNLARDDRVVLVFAFAFWSFDCDLLRRNFSSLLSLLQVCCVLYCTVLYLRT